MSCDVTFLFNKNKRRSFALSLCISMAEWKEYIEKIYMAPEQPGSFPAISVHCAYCITHIF